LGASIHYFDFGNPEILGRAYALLLYAEPFLSAHKNLSLSFRFGTGVTYLTNIYHSLKNPESLFYSSPMSFSLAAELLANYRQSQPNPEYNRMPCLSLINLKNMPILQGDVPKCGNFW